jgi:hypothetical protein
LLKTLSLTSRDFEVNAERDSDSARRLREREMSNESFSFSSSSLGVSRNMEGEERDFVGCGYLRRRDGVNVTKDHPDLLCQLVY